MSRVKFVSLIIGETFLSQMLKKLKMLALLATI